MNHYDIMQFARESLLPACLFEHPVALKRFAELVASKEREACAKECEKQMSGMECPERAQYCADAIRERTQE